MIRIIADEPYCIGILNLQKHFSRDIFSTNIEPIIEKSEYGIKRNNCRWGYLLPQEKNLSWINRLSGPE